MVYPYDGQEDVVPVFYEELPDPLPNHSVSGFPISISFNEIEFKSIKIVNFQLFDINGKEIRDTVFYNHNTDPNRKLKKYEFGVLPEFLELSLTMGGTNGIIGNNILINFDLVIDNLQNQIFIKK